MTACVFCEKSGPIAWRDGHQDEVATRRLPNGAEVPAHSGCAQDEAMDMAEDHELRRAEDEERVASEEVRG